MASIYRKNPTSEVIWLRYKNSAGVWKGKPTSYRWSNVGDVRQAHLLARRQTEIEAARCQGKGERLSEWVLPWLISKYGTMETTTPDRYKRMWRTLEKFLTERNILTAAQVEREVAGQYLEWRKATAGRNTAIQELKHLTMILDEAIERKHRADNPLRKLGLKKAAAKPKEIWSDGDMQKAAAHLERGKSRWMRCAFYFGVYQACRLRQCPLPLKSIRFDLGVIQYPDAFVKGLQGYTQPIDPRFLPLLRRLFQEATEAGASTICKVPWDASIRFRRTFDRAGLEGLCHHGLRATWITRAAENGIPESQAMAFCHHESREVHRIYKRLSALGIAHVPALMSLPTLCSSEASAPVGGAPGAMPGSASGS